MSSSTGSDSQATTALLQAELTRLRDSSGGAWHSYLTWFTWFFTIQVAVMGWVITKDSPKSSHGDNIDVMGAMFITFNLLGVIAAMRQLAYCSLQKRRAASVCAQLNARAESSGLAVEITSGFASDLVHSTLVIFCAALISSAVAWLYLIVREGSAWSGAG